MELAPETMTKPHTFGPPETKAVERPDRLTRVGCAWCGAPSGAAGGVTLRSVIVTKVKSYEKLLLCPGCLQEFEQFGRMLSYREWAQYFWQELARSFGFVVSVRRHAGQAWVQWKFRRRHEQVRALMVEGRLRAWWTDAAGILAAALVVAVAVAASWGAVELARRLWAVLNW